MLLLLAGIAAILFKLPHFGNVGFSGSGKNGDREKWNEVSNSNRDYRGVGRGAEKTSANPTRPIALAEARNMRLEDSKAVKDKLREMMRRDDEGLEIVTMPDGHQSIDLKGRFKHVSRLVQGKDGKLVVACGEFSPEEVAGE